MRCDIWEEKIRRKEPPRDCSCRGPISYEKLCDQRRSSLFGSQAQAPRPHPSGDATKMTTIYDPIDTTGGVAQAPDTANSHTSDGPVSWRVSWSYWQGGAAGWPPQARKTGGASR